MLRKKCVLGLVLIMVFSNRSIAQMRDKEVTGEYYLEGVMETASGIRLNADHTFEMVFTYGALDKAGGGTWKLENNMLMLDSGERPPSDFRMVSSRRKGSGITIQVTDANKMILSYMACRLSGTDFSDTLQADQNGMMRSDRLTADSIGLVHQLFSDRICYFDISKSHDNYFEFTIEEWILGLYCHNLKLTVHDGYLEGKHPMLDPSKTYIYRKAK